MILVTGGTGFIGSHLLFLLVQKEEKIRAIYREESSLKKTKRLFSLYSASADVFFDKIEWVQADITDIFSLEPVFEGIDKLYHTAAIVSFNPLDDKKMHAVNVEGTTNLLNLANVNHIHKIVHLSSVAALGNSDNPITEKTYWNWKENSSEYAHTKYLSEMEVWRATQEGLDAVIFNPSIVFGAGFWQEGTGSIFNRIYKGMPFYTNGVNGFVDVWDLVNIMIQAMQSNVVNDSFIVSAENISYKKVFDFIAEAFDKPKPKYLLKPWITNIIWRFEFLKSAGFKTKPILTKSIARSGFQQHYFSSKKLMNTFGFSYRPIEKTIKEIADIYLKNK